MKLLFILSFVSLLLVGNLKAFTVYEVIEKVVNNSPELRVIFERKNQVVEDYNESKSSYKPKIYFIFNREYLKNNPLTSSQESSWEGSNKFQMILEQRIFDLENISKIFKTAQTVQTTEFKNQKMLEALIELSIIAYYDVIQGEYIVSIYKEYLRQVRSMEQITINMRQQGDATLGDVNLVQTRLAAANSNLILNQANLDKVRLKLAYLLNLVGNNQITDSSTILPNLSSKDFYDVGDRIVNLLPLSPEDLINKVLQSNVDILSLRSDLCVAGYDIEVQKARYLPTVNMLGELRAEEGRAGQAFQRYGKISIEGRYMVYDGGSRNAAVKKFSSAFKEKEYQYDILVRDTSDQAYSTLNQLRSYEQQRLSILKEIETSEEVDRVYNIQFQFASRSLTDRLDNLERLTGARARLVQMDYSILSTRMRILTIMGVFVDFFGFQNYLEVDRLKLC